MLKNILVTGGAGYVGSPLLEILLNKGYNVIVLDNLSFGDESLQRIRHHPAFKLIKGDITFDNIIKTVFTKYKIDALIHLAAVVGNPACAKQPRRAKAVNWEASLKLLDYSIKNRVKRFVFASTCSNYGKMPDPSGYVDEASPLAPLSLYAELKTKFENVILTELKKKDGFYPVILRFATGYGVSSRMRFDLTVNEFTKELALSRELAVFGKQFWRPYCHVFDFARAILLVLTSGKDKIAYNVFNVGNTTENYRKKDIIEKIKKFIPDVKIKYIKKDRDPRDYRVSFEKIKNELGFTISRKLSDGIKEVKYLIDNKIISDVDNIKYRNS